MIPPLLNAAFWRPQSRTVRHMREKPDLPALEAALRKKAAELAKIRDENYERNLVIYEDGKCMAYTDAADIVAAMMREGGDGTQHD